MPVLSQHPFLGYSLGFIRLSLKERLTPLEAKSEYAEEIRDIKDIATGGILFWGFVFWLTNVWVIVTTSVIPGMAQRCTSMFITYLCAILGGAAILGGVLCALMVRRQEETGVGGIAALIADGKSTASYAGNLGCQDVGVCPLPEVGDPYT